MIRNQQLPKGTGDGGTPLCQALQHHEEHCDAVDFLEERDLGFYFQVFVFEARPHKTGTF